MRTECGVVPSRRKPLSPLDLAGRLERTDESVGRVRRLTIQRRTSATKPDRPTLSQRLMIIQTGPKAQNPINAKNQPKGKALEAFTQCWEYQTWLEALGT